MSRHIAKVIRLRKNNKYYKNREKDDIRLYNSIKRVNAYIRNYIKSVSID